jgi:hypothetical protein
MRGFAVFGFVLLVTVALLPGLATAAGDKPEWQVGDFWELDGYTEILSSQVDSSERYEVVAVESITQGGTTYQTYKLTVTSVIDALFTITTIEDRWYERDTLRLVRKEIKASNTTTVYDPPLARYKFPLVNGTAWTASSTRTIGDGNPRAVSFSMQVVLETDVPVRLTGTTVDRSFHSFAIREDDDVGIGFDQSYFSDEVGLWAMVEHYRSEGDLNKQLKLTSFQYTPPLLTPGVILLLLLLIIIVIVAVMVVLLARRRPKLPAPATYPGPQQMPQQQTYPGP